MLSNTNKGDAVLSWLNLGHGIIGIKERDAGLFLQIRDKKYPWVKLCWPLSSNDVFTLIFIVFTCEFIPHSLKPSTHRPNVWRLLDRVYYSQSERSSAWLLSKGHDQKRFANRLLISAHSQWLRALTGVSWRGGTPLSEHSSTAWEIALLTSNC